MRCMHRDLYNNSKHNHKKPLARETNRTINSKLTRHSFSVNRLKVGILMYIRIYTMSAFAILRTPIAMGASMKYKTGSIW